MKPIEGRLQSGEHLLAKIIEDKVDDVLVGICKFKEDHGILEMTSTTDLRELNLNELQDEVNVVVKKELKVTKIVKLREEAEKEVSVRKVPDSVKEIRIVDVEGFDKRPCRDPHVDNTKEIGKFIITKVKKVGKDRYRFLFEVD